MKSVVYQGVPGAFSECAARSFWGDEIVSLGKETFAAVFEALATQEAEAALIPIENTLIGSIWENYDLLPLFDVQVCGETTLRIEHCLLGVQGTGMSSAEQIQRLKRVYSHPKALDQCRAFFRTHPWIEPKVHFDTAGAAAEISLRKDPAEGAIASRRTAELYPLTLLHEGIEDDPHNFTRFLYLKKKGELLIGGNKCSLLFGLPHVPGALARVLHLLAQQEMNVTKLESRPIRGKPFEYLFYVDLLLPTAQCNTLKTEAMLTYVKEETQMLKVLGVYASHEL